jgi:hypothetical protein
LSPLKNTQSPGRILLIRETLTFLLPGTMPHIWAWPSGKSSLSWATVEASRRSAWSSKTTGWTIVSW